MALALTDAQRGRLLALAWRDPQFQKDIEFDPAAALAKLKTGTYVVKPTPLELKNNMGLDPNPAVKDRIVDLAIVEYPYPFQTGPCNELDAIVQGTRREPMEESDWLWDSINAKATDDKQPSRISLENWGRIYARIWMDHRIATLPVCKGKYGSQQSYLETFETDPAAAVETMLKETTWGPNPIPYTRGTTRLFVLRPKPDTWTDIQLETYVNTGILLGVTANHQLGWVVKKCC